MWVSDRDIHTHTHLDARAGLNSDPTTRHNLHVNDSVPCRRRTFTVSLGAGQQSEQLASYSNSFFFSSLLIYNFSFFSSSFPQHLLYRFLCRITHYCLNPHLFLIFHPISFSLFYVQHETPNILFFIICKSLSCVPPQVGFTCCGYQGCAYTGNKKNGFRQKLIVAF